MKKRVLGAVTMCAGAPLLALGVGTATGWADTKPDANRHEHHRANRRWQPGDLGGRNLAGEDRQK